MQMQMKPLSCGCKGNCSEGSHHLLSPAPLPLAHVGKVFFAILVVIVLDPRVFLKILDWSTAKEKAVRTVIDVAGSLERRVS